MTSTSLSGTTELVSAEALPEEVSYIKIVTRRFLRHRPAVISLIVLAIIFLIAIFAQSLSPFGPTDLEVGNKFAAPGTLSLDGARMHYLGTDVLGRDYWARIIYAARISLTVAISAQIGSSLL